MKKLTLILLFVGAFFSSAFSVVNYEVSTAEKGTNTVASYKGTTSGYILVSFFEGKTLLPIPGATVKLNGSAAGLTDANGELSVYCSSGDVLSIYYPSFINSFEVPGPDIIFPCCWPEELNQ